MCGRYADELTLESLKNGFPLIDRYAAEPAPNYNVAPGHEVLSIIRANGENVLGRLHWGLVPSWAADRKVGYKMINARAETVATKPSYRKPFKSRRCLIPASGYYEWELLLDRKIPYYITRSDQTVMAFAGLWEVWDDHGKLEKPYYSCTILTTEAYGVIASLHPRMPVVLRNRAYDQWLDTQAEIDLEKFLPDARYYNFATRRVTTEVNSVKNNYPELLNEIPRGYGDL